MKKIYVLLTLACFAIEIATIQLALPKYTQIISSIGFLSFLFYFALKTEGLINKTQKSTSKKTKTKTTVQSKPEPKKDDDESKTDDKEEEESEFTKEWEQLQKAAS